MAATSAQAYRMFRTLAGDIAVAPSAGSHARGAGRFGQASLELEENWCPVICIVGCSLRLMAQLFNGEGIYAIFGHGIRAFPGG